MNGIQGSKPLPGAEFWSRGIDEATVVRQDDPNDSSLPDGLGAAHRYPAAPTAADSGSGELSKEVLRVGQRQATPGTQGGSTPGVSTFAGMKLGTNGYSEEVRVKREVGSFQGYDDRYQAIAVARMANAEPAAVVQGNDGRWHALETTAVFYQMPFKATGTPTRGAYGLPSSARVGECTQRVNALRTRLNELADLKENGGDSQAIERERDQVTEDLGQARRTLASLIFGVPESEIQFNRSSIGRTPGKININGTPDRRSPGGAHGPVAGQGDTSFTPEMKTAFEIDISALDRPVRAQTTLFHEVSHWNDFELAKKWVANYQRETGHMFVNGPPGRPAFQKWLMSQPVSRLSKADAEVVLDEVAGVSTTTEARANVRTFLAALQAGAPDQASRELAAYAREMKPGGHYGTPLHGSAVQAELTAELGAAYRQMPKEMQRQFDAAIDATRKANPDAWVSKLQFGR